MIRYMVTAKKLRELITEEKTDWLANAEERTAAFRQNGGYDEKSSIWGEIKAVYMRLQGEGKCAYCERQLESVELGKVEQDVEHFRPKRNIKQWSASKSLLEAGITFAPVPNLDKGYYLLPYNMFNYAVACKPCNSTLKNDYFPIGGKYNLDSDDPTKLRSEGAYLIYPIGNIDADPETLIEFYGTSPRPVASRGRKRKRALVTIEFFRLDDPDKRKNLYRERALIIIALFPLLEKTKSGTPASKKKAKKDLEAFLKPYLRHLNCARSFQRLFGRDSVGAEAIYDAAVNFMASIS